MVGSSEHIQTTHSDTVSSTDRRLVGGMAVETAAMFLFGLTNNKELAHFFALTGLTTWVLTALRELLKKKQ